MSKAVSARKRRQKERMRERVAAPPFGLVRVNPSALVPNASYSVQPFVQTGYYEDRPFVCKDCGCAEIWRATQQKWWFEIAKGGQDSVAVHCRPCRRKRQATRATARAQAVTHYGEFALRRLLLDGSLKVEKWRPRVRAIQKLIAAGLGERFGHYDAARNPDVENFAEHYANAVVVVARRQREIVGCGVLLAEGGGHGAARARIVRMSVRSDVRRKGVGGAVLNELVGHARRLGYRQVVLETTSSWVDAVAFYQRHGFAVVERKHGDTHFRLDVQKEQVVE